MAETVKDFLIDIAKNFEGTHIFRARDENMVMEGYLIDGEIKVTRKKEFKPVEQSRSEFKQLLSEMKGKSANTKA